MKEINIEKIAESVLFFKDSGYNVSILNNGRVYGHKDSKENNHLRDVAIRCYYINNSYLFGGFPKTKEKLIKDLTKLFKC